MNRIGTLNLADIETVVGGVSSSLMADATLAARRPRQPRQPNGGDTTEPPMPDPNGTMNRPPR